MRYLIILILSIGFCSVSAQKQTKYESGINVIRDTAEYCSQVNDFSDAELVDISDYIPEIKLDMRYATDNNFTHEVIYDTALAFVRKPVAKALQSVQQSLNKQGLGIVIMDAYRPYAATVKFYEVYNDTNFVASPYSGSRHNRGAAVDISLIDLKTGEEIPMPTYFDDFSEKASPVYMDLSEEVIKNRELLISEMKKQGFTVYPSEWWHYDYNGWEVFPLMDLSFEQLLEIKRK